MQGFRVNDQSPPELNQPDGAFKQFFWQCTMDIESHFNEIVLQWTQENNTELSALIRLSEQDYNRSRDDLLKFVQTLLDKYLRKGKVEDRFKRPAHMWPASGSEFKGE